MAIIHSQRAVHHVRSGTQAESSNTRRYGGTGLGLAICRRLASALQGSLTVRSTEAVGSEFNFTIPLPVVEAPSEAEEMGSTDILPQSNLNVLVVEDNPVNRRVAQAMLTRVGCKVTSAKDGFEAVAATAGESFDLILMDCHMPNLDGFDATRRIRHEGNPNWRTPIVALSAGVLEQDVEKCRDAGMDGFLSKPLRTEQLSNLLVRLAEREKGQPLGWPSSQSNLS
ncbi:MAG: response regulator [Acidobacteria bacterium]|nr:response regulator [Acidobacteriota bacterium]